MENPDQTKTDDVTTAASAMAASMFTPEEQAMQKKIINERIAAEKEAERKKEMNSDFNLVYEATLKDPAIEPFKEVIEATLKENQELKNLGRDGVKPLLLLAKKEFELKNNKGMEQGTKVDTGQTTTGQIDENKEFKYSDVDSVQIKNPNVAIHVKRMQRLRK